MNCTCQSGGDQDASCIPAVLLIGTLMAICRTWVQILPMAPDWGHPGKEGLGVVLLFLRSRKLCSFFEVHGPRFCPGSVGKPRASSEMFVLVSASCWDEVEWFCQLLKILFILGTPTLTHIHSFVHRRSLAFRGPCLLCKYVRIPLFCACSPHNSDKRWLVFPGETLVIPLRPPQVHKGSFWSEASAVWGYQDSFSSALPHCALLSPFPVSLPVTPSIHNWWISTQAWPCRQEPRVASKFTASICARQNCHHPVSACLPELAWC